MADAIGARPKAGRGDRHGDTHFRVRHDRVADGGSVTLRIGGQLRHIAIGRAHTGTRIILLIADLDVRVIHATTGEILRHLTIDPNRRYHGTGRPPGPPPTTTTTARHLMRDRAVRDVLRHHIVGEAGFEPATSCSQSNTDADVASRNPSVWRNLC